MTRKEAHSLQLIHSNPSDSFWKTLTGKEAIRVISEVKIMTNKEIFEEKYADYLPASIISNMHDVKIKIQYHIGKGDFDSDYHVELLDEYEALKVLAETTELGRRLLAILN